VSSDNRLAVHELFKDLPRLETPRLVMRQLTHADVEPMFAYASDPEVSRYVSWTAHEPPAETARFIEFTLTKYRAGDVSDWAIEHRHDGRMIGTIGFVWWLPDHARVELGYAMHRNYWGQGLMSEAVAVVAAFGFARMNLNRIEARIIPANTGSRRVLEKNGFFCEGLLRQQARVKGRFADFLLYSLLASDYAQRMAAAAVDLRGDHR